MEFAVALPTLGDCAKSHFKPGKGALTLLYIKPVNGVGTSATQPENKKLKQQLSSIKVGFDYFPLGIAYMRNDGQFTAMNPRFKKIFGVPKESENISFDQIPSLKRDIGFEKMSDYIKLIKEMSYSVERNTQDKTINLKVDIRLLHEKKKSIKFYIVVVQRLN